MALGSGVLRTHASVMRALCGAAHTMSTRAAKVQEDALAFHRRGNFDIAPPPGDAAVHAVLRDRIVGGEAVFFRRIGAGQRNLWHCGLTTGRLQCEGREPPLVKGGRGLRDMQR